MAIIILLGWRLGVELQIVKVAVDAVLVEKRLMVAFFHYAAFLEDEDAVGVLNGAESVGDGEGRSAGEESLDRLLDESLARGV